MIAAPISPKLRMAAVASPEYFVDRKPPKTPRDLTQHRCISQRHISSGGLYAWEFERRGRELEARGRPSHPQHAAGNRASRAGRHGEIAYLLEGEFSPHLQEGRLVRVLEDWCPPFPG